MQALNYIKGDDLHMKKVFEKIGGGIIITAFAAVVLIAGKASAKAAERISLDTEYTVSMESEKVYEYTFTAPQKGSFHIETECNVSDVDNASYCNVRAAFSNGDTKYWDSYIKINGTDKSAEYSIKSGSEVTLSFDTLLHGYSPSNKYELKFKVVTNVPKNFENEGNDTPSKAVKLKKNKTYKGIVNAEDKDTDWYVFKVPKTGKYRFYVKNTSNTDSCVSMSVSGYKTKKKLDARNQATLIEGLEGYKSNKIKLKKGQKYYIKLSDSSPKTGSYELKIKNVK